MGDIEQSMPVNRVRPWQGTDAYDARRGGRRRHGEGHGGHRHPDDGDQVSLQGLDPAELSPQLQSVINGLAQELDALRWRLQQAEKRQEYLEDLADQDAWLPALNRRAFLRKLGLFLEHAGSQGVQGAIAVIYLDNFEDLRREHGLAAAMEALRHLTRQAGGALRAADVLGAIGGAGVAALMTTAHPEGARAKLERLMATVASRPLTIGGASLHLTPVAVLQPLHVGEDAETALLEAEGRLHAEGA